MTRLGRYRRREREEEKERQIFEEDYFVRTNIKKRKRAEGMAETIDDILDFSDLKSLTDKDGTKVTLTYILLGVIFSFADQEI